MNAYKPLIAFNLLHSIELLHDVCLSCRTKMIEGMQPNQINLNKNLEQSLMLVTALTPKIGYEKASEIAQYAHKKNISLKEAVIKLGYINEVDFNRIVNPISMTKNKL